jgi:hypothetical protein
MKTFIKIFFPFFVAFTTTFSQTTVGKYGGEFLSLGVGSRSFAMGGASVALVNDVTAGYWNPSALTSLQHTQLALMHEERFGNFLNYDYASVGFPMENNSALGISAIRLAADNNYDTRGALIDVNTGQTITNINNPNARIDPSKIKTFSVADVAIYLSYAKQQFDNLSLGANVKLIRRDNAEYNAFGVGFDVSAKYFVNEDFFLGANFQDVTTTFLSWNTGRNELISPTLKIGGAYFIDAFGGQIAPAVDFDVRFENRKYASNFHLGGISFDAHSGVEYIYHQMLAFRAGYSEIGQLTYGGGIHLGKFLIDYSFMQFSATNQFNTHRISLLFSLHTQQ